MPEPPHLRIAPVVRQQLGVGAALDDAARLHHQDLVGVDDGREPVRDHERGRAAARPLQLGLDGPLVGRIERRGGLVEDQDRRVLQQRARDRDALLLAARQLQPRSPTIVS